MVQRSTASRKALFPEVRVVGDGRQLVTAGYEFECACPNRHAYEDEEHPGRSTAKAEQKPVG